MNLIAFALCSIPDISAARRLYDGDGLDDQGIAKILFHRRKQLTGSEQLRPDQQRIALLSLVTGEPEHPRLETLSLAGGDEAGLLRHLGEALGGTARLAGWQLQDELALLRLRAISLGVAVPRLWQHEPLDLAGQWGSEAPLDEVARLMGLPGLGSSAGLDVWQAWQRGDHRQVHAAAELRAVNSWLLAHRLAVAQGHMTPALAKSAVQALRTHLAASDSDHLQACAAALEG